MKARKKPLNFNLTTPPGVPRDPIDHLLQFAAQQTCKAKGMTLSWSDGQTMCFLEGGLDSLKLERVSFLTACHHIPRMVATIRQMKKVLDGVATGSVELKSDEVTGALMEANETLYQLRTHWQSSMLINKQFLKTH